MTTTTECFKLQALLRGVALLLRALLFCEINSIALKAAGLMNQAQTTILFSLNWYPSGELAAEDLETVLKVLVGSGDLSKEEFSHQELQAA
jgi:hypothetical protein